MRKITKYFPGVKALSDVDFGLMKGEVQCSPDLQVHP
jgi:ABC-type sugar transport system ATPase subunit